MDCLRLTDAEWRAEINWCNPPMGVARRLGHQASKLGSGGDCHRPLMAQKAVVRAPRSDVDRVRRHAPQHRHLLSAEASGTRGDRAFRVERRGLVLQQQRDAALAAKRAQGSRTRRYALHLPTTTRKDWETSGTAAMNTVFGDDELGRAITILF